jgi:hypothetical protein
MHLGALLCRRQAIHSHLRTLATQKAQHMMLFEHYQQA